MAVTTAISDLFKSIYEVIASIVATVSHAFFAVFNLFANLVTSFVTFISDVLLGVLDIAEGLGKFVLGNILLFALVAVGGFAFVRYQQQQKGQSKIGGAKKTA